MSSPQFIKPYPNGYIDGEVGNTPVTAEILNTNYDAFLLALNEFLPELEDMVEANPSEAATAGNLTKLKVGNSIYLVPSGGSGGSTVEWEQLQLTGTKIATITIDNVPVDVYAPSGGGSGDEVSWNQVLGSGTKIGTITINEDPTDVYAPTPIDVEANPSGTATAGDLTKLKVGSSIYSIPSGGSGGASDLSDLDDVTITNVQNGQIIKWNSTTSKWENVNDTGGGSGHTILDDDGTALSQEDDLQFKGVYTADNSTDGVTEVNVYREMTKSQFDLLSADEKKGFIRTTDEPDIASVVDGVFVDTDNIIKNAEQYSNSNPINYTAVQDCIVKCFTGDVNSLWYLIDGEEIYFIKSDSTSILIPLKKGQVLTSNSSNSFNGWWKVYGIQQGSKTVNYHEYSTDEKVVGKWIDGKTIYEKTIDLGNLPNNTTKNVAHSISNLDKVINMLGSGFNSSLKFPLPYVNADDVSNSVQIQITSTNIEIKSRIDFSSYSGYLTLQYTKSS